MSYRLIETMLLLPDHVIRNQSLHMARLKKSCNQNGFFLT